MVEHSPGPWKIGSSWYLIDGKGGTGVAGVDVGTPCAGANARLIAAAPSLLEALQRVKSELGVPSGDYPAPVANAWTIADVALAQARPSVAGQEAGK